jgi:hypothetical protein
MAGYTLIGGGRFFVAWIAAINDLVHTSFSAMPDRRQHKINFY